jgi:hypothetical protein
MIWFIAIQLLEMDLSDLIIDALKKRGGYLTEEGVDMDYGVHLPLISFHGEPFTLDRLSIYTETAECHCFYVYVCHARWGKSETNAPRCY